MLSRANSVYPDTTTFDKLSSEQHLLIPESGCKQNNKLVVINFFIFFSQHIQLFLQLLR